MANNCWNYIEFSGDEDNLNRMFNDISVEHYNDLDRNKFDLPRWFEMNIEHGSFIISGDSAWSPPLNYTKFLCETYKVYAEHEYSESGNGFAGYYSCDPDGCTHDRELDYRDYIFEKGFDEWWHEYIECAERYSFLTENDEYDYVFHSNMTLEQVIETHFYILFEESITLKIYL